MKVMLDEVDHALEEVSQTEGNQTITAQKKKIDFNTITE